MYKPTDSIVHQGMTSKQLVDAYDIYKEMPDPIFWLRENRDRAQIMKDKLKPISDISYGDEILQKLDIYAPKNKRQMPVLIDIHGGGWSVGSKNPRAIPAEAVMSKDVIWVPIDYGLAPQYSMKEIISHVHCAIAWIYKNIMQYGGDQNRLYLYGTSAGAHLAATMLISDWHKNYGVPEDVIKGVVAISGVFDLDCLAYLQIDHKALSINQEESRRYSPLYHLPKHPVPVVIAYGEHDPLGYILESKNYAQEIQHANCNTTLIEIPHANHFDTFNVLENTDGDVFKMVMEMMK